MSYYLTFTNANEQIHIAAEWLIYVSSDGNYSDIHLLNGERHTLSQQLGTIEALIINQLQYNKQDNEDIDKTLLPVIRLLQIHKPKFVRIGKSLIVNLHYVHYINPNKKQLILTDCQTFKTTLDASKDALKKLKDYLEKQSKE